MKKQGIEPSEIAKNHSQTSTASSKHSNLMTDNEQNLYPPTTTKIATKLPLSRGTLIQLIFWLVLTAVIQGFFAYYFEQNETRSSAAIAIGGCLVGALLSYSVFLAPFLKVGIVERAYLATMIRMGISLAIALVLLRQIDAPQYQLRMAIYILSAYGISLLVETILIAKSLSSGNSKNVFKQSSEQPDKS